MISINDIQAVRAASAYTRDGHKTGRVGDVYVDDLSGQPAWVTITAGLFGTKTLFAPLEGATLNGDRLVLAYDKDVIGGAPVIADSGHISDVEQQALIDYFTTHQANAPVAQEAPAAQAPAPAYDPSAYQAPAPAYQPEAPAYDAPTPAAPGVPEADFASDDTIIAPAGLPTAPDAVGMAVPVAGYATDAPAYGAPTGAIIDAAGDQVTPVSEAEHWASSESAAPMVSPYGGRSEEANLADIEQAGGVPGFGEFGTGEAATVVDATQIDPVALAQDEADHGAWGQDATAPSADQDATVLGAAVVTDGAYEVGEAIVEGENGPSVVEFGGPVADAASEASDGSSDAGEAPAESDSATEQAAEPSPEADALGMDVPSTGWQGDEPAGDAPEGSIIDSAGDQVTPVAASPDWAMSEDAALMVSPYGGLSEEANLGIAEEEVGAADEVAAVVDATEADVDAIAEDAAEHGAASEAASDEAAAEGSDADADPFAVSAPVIALGAAGIAGVAAVAASDSEGDDAPADAADEAETPAEEIAAAADAAEGDASADDVAPAEDEAAVDDQAPSEVESEDADADAVEVDEVAVVAEAAPHVPASGADAAPAEGDTSAQVAMSGQFRMYPGHTRETIYRDGDGNILYSVVHSYEDIFDGGEGI